ncbi:MAG: GNAT family N-acetyltransferase [Hyphomicrobiaceae bacterium]
MTLEAPFRAGRIEDAALLCELVNYAGERLPLYLWGKLATPEQDAWAVGYSRAVRDAGSFSYRNAIVIEDDGQAAGCLIGYAIPDTIEPVPDDIPPMFRPLQELENLAPGSWYVNVLAVVPDRRSRGLGRKLLDLAEDRARRSGHGAMSIIVSDANVGARRLYERCAYDEAGTRPMIKDNWDNDGENWVLLTKRLDA